LQNVSATRAVVVWTTTQAGAAGMVRYAALAGSVRLAPSTVRELPAYETGLPQSLYQHRAELTGLEAGQRYRYRVLQDGVDLLPLLRPDELTFGTPAAGPFEFLVFGDSGDGGGPQHAVADLMLREQPDLVLHTGDLAYQQGTFPQLEDFYLRTYWPLMRRVPFFPVAGNHDYAFHEGAAFVALHDLPSEGVPERGRGRYYSFDWGNVHFIALDSNTPLREALTGEGEMLRWLERDLAATRQEFRVVYFHHTPFPTANYREDEYCQRVSSALTGILERHGVHLVLVGHEHLYQRTKPRRGAFREQIGTVYITTGGAGSTVYPPAGPAPFLEKGLGASHYLRVRVTEHQLRVEAIGLGHELLDEFTIASAPQVETGGVREAATGGSALAPGALASLFGANLAPGDTTAAGFPLPRTLAGATLKLDGRPVPLLYAGRNQVNFQIPFGLAPGRHELTVENAGGAAQLPLTLSAVAPAIFRAGDGPALIHPDGALVSSGRPARPGELLTVFLTGLGPPLGPLPDGVAAPASQPVRIDAVVRVEAGGEECEVLFAGFTPGFAGLNQVNFRLPAGVAAGTVSLRVTANGAASGVAAIPVR